ncbi:MAG TPA: hypothetical protein PK152_01365 [Anaerolineales bacterium]|nr:hypothetical protein [Anaerolineae bacterium]HRJ56511.1 hypothetical protein [Anaerolineales bacterium]HRK87751.1 hypothetical protein [Anaerolineales bacterium]
MFTHTDWLVHLEHHKYLLREAEKERLVKIALSARKIEKKAKVQQSKPSRNKEVVCCTTAAA